MNEVSQVPEKQEDKRFVEKGPFVVFDKVTQIYWMKKDSWQDKGKFFNWHESREYADKKNIRSIGGFNDWRLATTEEAQTLFDESFENPGKSGTLLHIDKTFPEGGFKTIWLAGDTSTRRPRFDFSTGQLANADEYTFGAVRLCRKDPHSQDKMKKRRR